MEEEEEKKTMLKSLVSFNTVAFGGNNVDHFVICTVRVCFISSYAWCA